MMNGVIWNVMIKRGYETILPQLIKEQCSQLAISCQIFAYDAAGSDLLILLDLESEEGKRRFQDTLTFACMKKYMQIMCSYEECMEATL